MENEDRLRDKLTSQLKTMNAAMDKLEQYNRQDRKAWVSSKKQNVGHIPRSTPSKQDLDTGSASQAGQTVQSTPTVAGEQRPSKKGQNPRFQPPSLTSSGTQTVSQPISSGRSAFPSRLPECFLYPEVQQAFTNGPGEYLRGAHDQKNADERQAREDRRIAMAVHNVADPCLRTPIIRDVRIHPRPASLSSQCGTVLANEDDYLVKEEGPHDDSEWDRCLSPPNVRDHGSNARPTSLNSQCGTVLANEHDYFVGQEESHDEGEWDRCEMSSGEE